MQERHLRVPTDSGVMETFMARPNARACPLVIIYMDVWGIREELYGIARELATSGYCSVAPDLYYRLGRVRHAFRDTNGRMITLARLAPAQQEEVRAPLRTLTDAMVIDDTRALLAFADCELDTSARPVGAIGYCMGGRFALAAFGRFHTRVRVAASLHGTALVTADTASPHRLAALGQGEIYCGFAERDPHGAPDVVAALAAEFQRAGLAYRYEVHRGAEHGYALPDRDIHDREATCRDWQAILAMLRRQLSGSAPEQNRPAAVSLRGNAPDVTGAALSPSSEAIGGKE
jgi:carboxymethylenebutenolidase